MATYENKGKPENVLAAFSQLTDQQTRSLMQLGQEIVEVWQSQSPEEQKASTELARAYLNCAKDDVEATKLLYEKRLFPLCVYHLQQAVEKATKAYALASFAMTADELKGKKGVGHKSPLVFIKMLRKKWVGRYIKLMKMFHPELRTNIGEVENIINKKQEELARLPKQTILAFLSLNRQIRSKLGRDEVVKQIYSQLEALPKQLSALLPREPTENLIMTVKTGLRLDMVWTFGGFYILSVITYPHAIFTRYPDREIKPSEYSANLGIVESVNDILSEVETGVVVLEDYLYSKVVVNR